MSSSRFWLLVAGVLAAAIMLPAAPVPRGECFPVESLPMDLRPQAEALLLRMLDTEALYTLAGGLKPMSSGFARYRVSLQDLRIGEVDQARRLLHALRCGDDIYATVQLFSRLSPAPSSSNGAGGLERAFEGVVFHVPSYRRAIAQHASFFALHGLTPFSHPMETVMTVEHIENPPRLRGFGYLFGYPDHAVDWFVNAEVERRRTGKLVEREFLSIPTFERAENQFVYAVPKGHALRVEDLDLRSRAGEILAEYRRLRAEYVGEGKRGVVELMRDWYAAGPGVCDPAAFRLARETSVSAGKN
jgi:hypothetical protein